MPDFHRDRVKVGVSGTPGTGTITLGSAASGFQAFQAGDNGLTFSVTLRDGTAWETATGCTYTHSGTTLTRGTRQASSTGAALSLTSAATVEVAVLADFGNRTEQSLLALTTGADANTTLAPGTRTVTDMSAWATANRDYTLPTTAAINDVVEVQVLVGSPTRAIVLKTGAGQTCAVGGFTIAAASEITRLFLAGEMMRFRYVATNKWQCEVDGRVRDVIEVTANGSTTQTVARNTNTQVAGVLTTVNRNDSTSWDTTNKRIVARRAGRWSVSILCTLVAVQSSKAVLVFLQKNGPAYVGNSPISFGNGIANMAAGLSTEVTLAVGDTLEMQIFYEDTSVDRATSNGANENYFRARWLGN